MISLDQVQVIIPALNEEGSIGIVVEGLRKRGLTRVRVIDNGSMDQTVEVARKAGAEVLMEKQRGYGAACWRGMQELPEEVEWILFCDGDGSDNLDDLPQFFKVSETHDLILGNRRTKAASRAVMTPVQNFGNWLATFLIWLGWGGRFEDLGPLRLIRRKALDQIAMQDRGFGWTVEMQARAAELKLRCIEIPVDYLRRLNGHSKISGTLKGSFQAGTIILGTLGKLWLQKKIVQEMLGPLAALCILAGSVVMRPCGDFRDVAVMPAFFAGAALMSAGYVCSWGLRSVSWLLFLSVAVIVRLNLLFMHPGDDIFRYIWEGLIQNQGFSPYLLPPNAPQLAALRPEWWHEIGHPSVTAIYPPVAQILLRILAFISPSVLFFKFCFAVADLAVGLLLARRFGVARATLYAWNPLVLYSFAGGGHYDSFFLLAMTAGWLVLENQRAFKGGEFLASLFWGLSIGLKWVSAPLLAALCWRYRISLKSILLGLCAILPFLLAWLYFFPTTGLRQLAPSDFVSKARGFDLIPSLLDPLLPDSVSLTPIFIALALVSGICLVLLVRSFPLCCQSWFLLLLMLSPMIHAWYFTWLTPFAVATRSWAVRLAGLSAFAYFQVHVTKAAGGGWTQTPYEKALVWGPILLGLTLDLILQWNSRRKSS